jgi:hypothetical protein
MVATAAPCASASSGVGCLASSSVYFFQVLPVSCEDWLLDIEAQLLIGAAPELGPFARSSARELTIRSACCQGSCRMVLST